MHLALTLDLVSTVKTFHVQVSSNNRSGGAYTYLRILEQTEG